ncbi:MAG: PDZ domain-containing protein [Fibrobacter sp.]|nr:PDZ domain-containing protein [Fibrobacter sp.]
MNRFIKASLIAAAFGMAATPVLAENESFGGIGVTIYQLKKGVKVAEVIPGTPAAESKLQSGDVIIAVDGQSLAGLTIDESKDLLRGQANKPLELTFVSGADTLSTVIRRAKIKVKDLDAEKVEAWYGDKKEFNAEELETFASANSEDQLVAVLKHGYRISEKNVNSKGLNGIYVEKAEEFAPKAPKQNNGKADKAILKGFSRNAVSFELKTAGTVVVTIMSAEGEQVAVLRSENAQPGFNTLSWNSDNVPSGRYMVSIEQNGNVSGRNAVLK